ncbi:MAG: TlpA disulfide reductase family protein [Pseudomonadota bacterium]
MYSTQNYAHRYAYKLLAIFLLLLSSAALAASGQERAETAGRSLIGAAAPRLVFKSIDGVDVDLGSLYGKKAVYLKFWATWCQPCREQMPHFQRSYEQAGADLAVIGVNAGFNDTVADVREYRRSLGLGMPLIIDDGRLASALHLRVTPQHIVIGRDGRILYVGHLADARLDAALLAARLPAANKAALPGPDAGQAAAERHYSTGDRLPALKLKTLDGTAFPLREPAARRPTVLVFLSPWCESYLAGSRPEISANCRSVREQVSVLAKDSRMRWLGVASGLWASKEELGSYRDEFKIPIPLVLDDSGDLFRAFGVNSVPTLLVVDADGKIIRRIEGPAVRPSAKLASLL